MSYNTRSLGLALTLGLGVLLTPSAHGQIGVQTVTVAYQDATGKGSLTILPLEKLPNTTDTAPYRAQFTLEKSGIFSSGSGIYQYQPASQNYLLAFAMPVDGRVLFYTARTFAAPIGAEIKGSGTYFPMDHPEQVLPWDLGTPGTGTGGGTGENPATVQTAQLLSLINQLRQSNGLPALTRVKALDQAATGQANDMAKLDVISTRGADGSSIVERLTRQGYNWRAAGEVVGTTTTLSADAVFASWSQVAGTKLFLLSASFTECGIGVGNVAANRFYWCLDLAAPR